MLVMLRLSNPILYVCREGCVCVCVLFWVFIYLFFSVFIFLFYVVCSKAKINSNGDHKHFDWYTRLMCKTWKTENVIQVAKKVLLEFTNMIVRGSSVNALGVNI